MKTCPKCAHSNDDELEICENCGVPLDAELNEDGKDPFIDTLLVGKFRIAELIGQGAMGRVYKAIQEPINRKVAIKILHQHLMEDQRVAKRFRREAEAASRFSHPNSIGIFDFGQTEEGSLYIAMEYIVGEDLAEVIAREAPLTPERAVKIATQALGAIHLAHDANIIHRDLKPENIMLADLPGNKDFAKVCDFGIAKIQQPATDGESALTMFGMICGTPYYMSPEQAKGEELDGRTDLYSMGVILYEMLTGDVPFRGSTPVEVIARHLTDQPEPISKVAPEARVPRLLEKAIMRSLSKKREDRFANAQEFSEELQKALKEAELQADLERVLLEAEEPAPVDASKSIPVAKPKSSGTPVASTRPPSGMIATTKPASSSEPVIPSVPGPLPPIGAPHAGPGLPNAAKPPVTGNNPGYTPILGPNITPGGGLPKVPPNQAPLRTPASSFKPAPMAPMNQGRPAISSTPRTSSGSPSPIELDSLPEPDFGKKSSSRWIFLLLLLVGAVIGGYALWANQQGKSMIKPEERRTKTRRRVRVKRPRRMVKRRPSARRGVSALQRKQQETFRTTYKKVQGWLNKYKLSPRYDLGRKNRKLYFRAAKLAKKGELGKANKQLKQLVRRLNRMRKLPHYIANIKYQRLQQLHKRAVRRKSINKNIKKLIEDDIFPKIYKAYVGGKTESMNVYMNKAFRLLR